MSDGKQKNINSAQLGISVLLALILGVGGGFLAGNAIGENHDHDDHASEETSHTDDDHDHAAEESAMADEMHSHDSMFMVSEEDAPTISLTVEKDAKSGYNVSIETTKFTFAPDNVNEENVVGEGHAHLYVDGEKIGRLYGPNFHYSGSVEGSATFRVALNSNMHSEYAVNGETIEATFEVTE